MGARPISRAVDELVRVPLSKKVLFENLTDCNVNVICNEDEIHFEIVHNNRIDYVENVNTVEDSTVNDDGVIVLNQFKPKE